MTSLEKPSHHPAAVPARASQSTTSAKLRPQDLGPCEAALLEIVRLAGAMMPDAGEGAASARLHHQPFGSSVAGSGRGASGAMPAPLVQSPREHLERALVGLDAEVALKLRTLMIAGRDGKSIGTVNVNMTVADGAAAFAVAALDSSENGPLLADYLRRGHALACATGLHLERPLSAWAAWVPSSLEERAWLSFGKQLATSSLDEWQCVGFVDAGAQAISRLYLRLHEHAWWSFQNTLDRPSAVAVERQKRALTSRRSKGLSARSLSSLFPLLSTTRDRALLRAARAIRARVGEVSSAA